MMQKLNSPDRKPEVDFGKKVSQKYRKAYQRKLRRKEYSKLRAILPSISKKEKVSKVTVVEEAIKYIDELHMALYQRLQEKGLTDAKATPDSMAQMVQAFAPFHMMNPRSQQTNLPMTSSVYEKDQKRPSYLTPPHGHKRV